LFQNAEGSFTARSSSFLDQLNALPLLNPTQIPNGQNNLWLDVHLADFNGDKYDDIVAGFGHGSAYSYVFWNNKGNFSFDDKTPLPATVYGTENTLHMETRTTDMDKDGDLDLIISHSRYSPYYGGDYLQIIRNDAGKFVDISSTAIRQDNSDVYAGFLQWSPALYVKDVSKDGKDDIVFARQDGTLRIFINENGASFRNFNVSLPPSEGSGKLIGFDDFDGDVKYHLGLTADKITSSGKKININLAPNPSHLETVGAVIEGITRAKQDKYFPDDFSKVLPIAVHGDAAVAGQGIVYEIVQMAQLEGYKTGGTIHIVINNQVGFTTNYLDARSSTYCTDVAKVTLSPVLHVNSDDAEAVVHAMLFALDFRMQFGRDVFIDLLGYRKYGHNEGDEPRFTQPVLYKLIAKHRNPRDIYAEKLISAGIKSRFLNS
jgi:hypothetical protein